MNSSTHASADSSETCRTIKPLAADDRNLLAKKSDENGDLGCFKQKHNTSIAKAAGMTKGKKSLFPTPCLLKKKPEKAK